MVVEELFNLLQEGTRGCSLDNTKVTVAFFEIYGGFIQDLLNDRNRLKILEDGQGEIVVTGLQEHEAQDAPHLLEMVTTGNLIRTTHATEANDTSSRSHAICQVCQKIICMWTFLVFCCNHSQNKLFFAVDFFAKQGHWKAIGENEFGGFSWE